MKIQLKRSNVLDGGVAKAPTAGQMEYGELAVNYSSTDPVLFIKDSTNSIVRLSSRSVPDISNPDYQADTLDERYVPLGSWANISTLPST